VEDPAWCRTPVDNFILEKLDAAGITPNPPAGKHTLLRRVTFTLTGLPPTREESEEYLADDSPEAFARVVSFVHRYTKTLIGIQLGHAGRRGAVARAWVDDPPAADPWPLVSASAIPYRTDGLVPRAVTRNDMERIRDDFVAAAVRARACGFDVLSLQLAGGYLLASFLSPLTNRRDDDHGGSLAGRLRFPVEVATAVREVWPGPLAARISATDWADGGLTPDDAVALAVAIRDAGCDILEVTTGENVIHEQPARGRLFQTQYADRIRNEVGIPTMAVGRISSYQDINSIVAAARADLCVLGRAMLFDPHFCRRAAYEQGHDLPWPDAYWAAREFVPR